MASDKALVLWGGYEGHEPQKAVEKFVPFLEGSGFDVEVVNSLAAYADPDTMSCNGVTRVTAVRVGQPLTKGRVFYTSWGHQASDFDVPEARTIVERGMLGAAGR